MNARIARSLGWGAVLAYLLTAFRLWDAWPAHWGEDMRGAACGAALFIAIVLFAIGALSDAWSETR